MCKNGKTHDQLELLPPRPLLPPVPKGWRCLSIRQPWAYLILHGGKDVENRSWPTSFRGRLLIHASGGMTKREWKYARDYAIWQCGYDKPFPAYESLHRGGIVGWVELVSCVESSTSPWFEGPYGFLLRNPQPLEFTPCRGQLGFFTYR